MRICGNCDEPLNKGQEKFCGKSCAIAFSNKHRKVSKSTKEKISISIRKWWENNPQKKTIHQYVCVKCGTIFERSLKIRKGRKIHCDDCKRKTVYVKEIEDVTSILQLSKRTVGKIFKRLGIGCSHCGWNLCACDIHHIVSRRNGGTDKHSNLAYLCPNDHRAAKYGLITEFVTLDEQIKDTWKLVYNKRG